MLSNSHQQYQRTQAETARRGDLVVMLYEGAISAIGRAGVHLERRETEAAHTQFLRAQDIIAELEYTLNMEAGQIAWQLKALYQYMRDRLLTANTTKDAAPANEVASLLRDLLPAWRAAANATSPSRPGSLAAALA